MVPNRSTCFLSQEDFDALRAKYPKFNESWNKDDLETLKQMAADGVPPETMSEQLGRTPKAIRLKLKSLGLWASKPAPKPWTAEDDAVLIEMYAAGESFEDMAAHFDRSLKAIVSRLVRLRVQLFPVQ